MAETMAPSRYSRFESMAKRRRYSESYLNIGFTTVLANDGIEKPQCVLCHTILSAESLKPSKLKRHLETKHPEHAKKDLNFFKRHERCLKSQRLNRSGSFQQQIATLDESTDVSSCSQLLVFVRYINSGDIKDEFLFCSALETTTKAVMEKVATFFQEEDLQWENVCGEVLESVIKIVNYIKTKALNTRLFKELCKDMNADHEVLLFYTAVRWLSKGNVINRVFEMKDEIKLFLDSQERKDLVVHFEDEAWNKRVAYLADFLTS
ncbi:zinc finger BED domain-containing protein 5-like [Palaemon carinicauda]|uniref:zinc finger BED domain-containing protein 5-like n=1 Tax=Palaemon carinicauda TaxID=392227 RepID=UPI0035B57F44